MMLATQSDHRGDDKNIWIWSSFSTMEEARAVAKIVVDERLAFCAQVISSVCSYFIWQDKTQEENEAVLICKSYQSMSQILVDKMTKLHSYEAPGIWCIDADIMHSEHSEKSDYADWARNVLKKTDCMNRS